MTNYLVRTSRLGDWPSYASPDGRYVAVPNTRPAMRGPNAKVRDGWDLTDTWTEVSRRYDTLEDVEREIANRAMRRDDVRAQGDRFTGWYTLAQVGDRGSGFTELRLTMKRPSTHSMLLGLVSITSDEVRAKGVINLLNTAGLLDLPEVKR